MDQKNKNLKGKQYLVELAWLSLLMYYSDGQFVQFPCFDLSCPHHQVAGQIICPSQDIPNPQTLKDMEKNSPIVKLPDWKCLQLLRLTWATGEEAAPTRSAPSRPPCQPSRPCQHHFLNDDAPQCVSMACPWESRNSLSGINGEKARQSFLFNLEPW